MLHHYIAVKSLPLNSFQEYIENELLFLAIALHKPSLKKKPLAVPELSHNHV